MRAHESFWLNKSEAFQELIYFNENMEDSKMRVDESSCKLVDLIFFYKNFQQIAQSLLAQGSWWGRVKIAKRNPRKISSNFANLVSKGSFSQEMRVLFVLQYF